MPTRVLVLGSSGMAGHVMSLYLREEGGLDVVDVGPRCVIFQGTRLADLENPAEVKALIGDTEPEVVINCTGVLVKAAETRKREAAWLNACLPHLLSEICSCSGIRLIHLSTDCVFSGGNGPYVEDSYRDGDAFYDRSKALGELCNSRDLTIRTSIIGPELRSDGSGLFNWTMKQRGEVHGFRKALWSGVTTLELAKFAFFAIRSNPGLSGLVHYSVPGGISKLDLISEINEIFELGLLMISVDEPVLDKRLVCTRRDIGMQPPPYRDQLVELRTWMGKHPDLYSIYSERS